MPKLNQEVLKVIVSTRDLDEPLEFCVEGGPASLSVVRSEIGKVLNGGKFIAFAEFIIPVDTIELIETVVSDRELTNKEESEDWMI